MIERSGNNNKDPLHGVKLVEILNFLVDEYGWDVLGQKINIRSFNYDPSINSSLKFLRKTQWARDKVESLYLYALRQKKKRENLS